MYNTEQSFPSVSITPARHVALIMDGNRRWAKSRGLPPLEGHRQGAKALKEIVKSCPEFGVRYLTVYAFSSENWGRPESEVLGLMELMQEYLEHEIEELHAQGVCLRVIGQREDLSPGLQALIKSAEAKTQANKRLGLQVAISYGGRGEMVRAFQKLVFEVQKGALAPEEITESLLASYLDTRGIPDPDLFIRTSGETRISNYLLWQIAYTELLFLETLWPDFKPADLQKALEVYRKRERRFGKAA